DSRVSPSGVNPILCDGVPSFTDTTGNVLVAGTGYKKRFHFNACRRRVLHPSRHEFIQVATGAGQYRADPFCSSQLPDPAICRAGEYRDHAKPGETERM